MSGSNEIKRLGDESIRRIVAEQAVTDLSSIVKELVDNALDAESTTIKIRLFGQGIDIIEVSDDGTGVPLESRSQMATRYTTSKINSFAEIYSGTGLTMGFRGEALFSMACLSEKLVVSTRTESEEMAQRLEFERDGSLNEDSITSIHRKVGCTVAVVKPFFALPARRADMTRRITSERTKIFRLMEAYAIFNIGVTFNLIDADSGRENLALATSSSSTKLEETVSAVIGPKFLKTLSPLELNLKQIFDHQDSEYINWGITGMISKNPKDKPQQRTINIYSINGRVVDIPKLTNLLRKIWKGFGGTKKPSCILSFTLPNDKFDINLSPDKQQVLLTDEQEIFHLIQEYVTNFYSNQVNGVFQTQEIELHTQEDGLVEEERQPHKRRYAFVHDPSKAIMQHDLPNRQNTQEEEEEKKKGLNENNIHEVEESDASEEPPSKKAKVTFEVPLSSTERSNRQEDSTDKQYEDTSDRISDMERIQFNNVKMKFQQNESDIDIQESMTQNDSTTSPDVPPPEATMGKESQTKENYYGEDEARNKKNRAISEPSAVSNLPTKSNNGTTAKQKQTHEEDDLVESEPELTASQETTEATEDSSSVQSEEQNSNEKLPTNQNQRHTHQPQEVEEVEEVSSPEDESQTLPTIWNSFQGTEMVSCSARQERLHMCQRKKSQIEIRNYARESSLEEGAEGVGESVGSQQFSTGGTVSLSKEEFRGNMKVLGQFNLGFILCLCKNNNLWILDQHACDEKFNFESLCRNTTLHEQKLLKPMPLDLTPSEEACVLDHRKIFEANGFHFEFRPSEPIRHRLFLTALPHSGAQNGRKAVQFGKDDVRALCAMLSDGSSYDAGDGGTGTDGAGMYGNNAVRRYASTSSQQADTAERLVTRLPKAIAMFASRACRSSIMIGTALSPGEMEKIVSRLADVEHPWNCPHGRPTMRHVGDVLKCMLQDERRAAEHITDPTVTVTPMTQENPMDD